LKEGDSRLQIFIDLTEAFAAAKRIRNMRPRALAETGAVQLDLNSPEGDEKGPQGVKIELQNIFFKYPSRNIPVLNGLNMTVSLTTKYGYRHSLLPD
jgi:ATP-binding cassette subfamily B (MDR/TAP) protein 1